MGALWWCAVFASDHVQRWTLGGWSRELLVGPDLVLFVGASALAAVRGERAFAVVAAVWTTLVTAALAAYALVEREAGWGAVAMAFAAVGTGAAALTLWFGRLPVRWFFVGPFAFRVAGDRPRGRHVRRSLMQLLIFWTLFLILTPILLSWIEHRLRLAWPPLQNSGCAAVGVTVFAVASALGLWSCLSMAIQGDGTPLLSHPGFDAVLVPWLSGPEKETVEHGSSPEVLR